MKNPTLPLLIAGALFATASAQTVFDNGDATDSFIENVLNWDNGAPSAVNPGTIGINANVGLGTITDWVVTQSAGNITLGGFPNVAFSMSGGSWTMNGGSFNQRSHTYTNGAVFTINNGSITTVNNSTITVTGTGSQMVVNGGTVTADRGIRLTGGGNFTLNGGTVNSDVADPFAFSGAGPSGSLNFNGGTLAAGRFAFQTATDIATFGGSTAGSASFTDWGTGNGAGNDGDRADDRNIKLNFNAGSQMTLSMGSSTRELDFDDNTFGDAGTHWAEALWQTGRLFYTDGATVVSGLDPASNGWSIVSWADATSDTAGLGTASNEYFNFTSAGDFGGSLVLAAIPEPSTLVLVGIALLSLLARGRRFES